MAKKAMIIKEQKRESLAAQGKYPRVRLHNRCSICGRPHGFHRDFGLCRICLRKMAHQGLLPGVTKASWQFLFILFICLKADVYQPFLVAFGVKLILDNMLGLPYNKCKVSLTA